MKAFQKLFIARIKMFLRDKASLFWNMFFPVMFILIFGIFNFDKVSTSNVTIIDQVKSPISQEFIQNLSKIEILKVNSDYTDVESAKTALKERKIDFIIVIPQTFGVIDTTTGQSTPLTVYYDKANVQLNGLVFGLLDQFMSQMNMQIAKTPQIFQLQKQEIEVKDIKYLDTLVPGILGMAIMQSGLFGIAFGIVRFREKGTLRKLMSTPLRIRDFLSSFVASYMVISLIQVTFILLISILVFKVHVFGDVLLIYLLSFMGQLIFLSMGFAIAGIAKTIDMAEGIVQVVSMPMMFLSGVFFSREALPLVVRNIVNYLPLSPLIDAMRKVAVQGLGFGDLKNEMLLMAVWIVISSLLAIKFFKFELE